MTSSAASLSPVNRCAKETTQSRYRKYSVSNAAESPLLIAAISSRSELSPADRDVGAARFVASGLSIAGNGASTRKLCAIVHGFSPDLQVIKRGNRRKGSISFKNKSCISTQSG